MLYTYDAIDKEVKPEVRQANAEVLDRSGQSNIRISGGVGSDAVVVSSAGCIVVATVANNAIIDSSPTAASAKSASKCTIL